MELYFTGKLDDKIIRDQVETIVIAGNETTALSLSYIILLLAMYPDVQEMAYNELHSIFNSQDEEIKYEHIQRLSYMERVIKEGMRILPVVPFMMRTATADTQISNCTIPKDAYILMSIFNLHRVSLVFFNFSVSANVFLFFFHLIRAKLKGKKNHFWNAFLNSFSFGFFSSAQSKPAPRSLGWWCWWIQSGSFLTRKC